MRVHQRPHIRGGVHDGPKTIDGLHDNDVVLKRKDEVAPGFAPETREDQVEGSGVKKGPKGVPLFGAPLCREGEELCAFGTPHVVGQHLPPMDHLRRLPLHPLKAGDKDGKARSSTAIAAAREMSLNALVWSICSTPSVGFLAR